jgi:hypothetical protein
MSLWLQGISTDITLAEPRDPLQQQDRPGEDQELDSMDSSSTCSIPLPQLPEYERFIENSNAYEWLLARVEQHDRLANGEVDALKKIEDEILTHLRSQRHLDTMSSSRPQALACMTFHLQWEPREYMISLGLQPDSYDLNTILCLTGTKHESQAVSVIEYLRQTWPTSADMGVIPMLQKLVTLQKGQSATCRYERKTIRVLADAGKGYPILSRRACSISMARGSWGAFTISIIAGAQLISDFAQQLAWLAATLRLSPEKQGIVMCYPRIRGLSTGISPKSYPTIRSTGTCHLSFRFERLSTEDCNNSGLCWASMFVNPILVTGFPTLRRPDSRPGMEMFLSTIAGLSLANKVVKIGERIMIKSFNVLLVAVLTTASVAVWHCFVSEKPEERISYFDSRLDSLKIDTSATHSLRSLDTVRHVVGWCPSATDFCGTL